MSVDLFAEHRLIQAAADAFLQALREGGSASSERIARLRAQLAGQTRRHRASEDALIFVPFMAAGGFDRLPEVQPHVHAIRLEWLNYSTHVRNWTPAAIEADRDGYVRAVEHRVDILRTMTAYEEREVYGPILHLLGQMPRSASAA